MSIFAVIASSNPDALQAAITTRYGIQGGSWFPFSPTAWFVHDTGTTKDLADRIGLTNGALGAQGVVISVSGYSGWASGAAWTWLQQFPEARSNG